MNLFGWLHKGTTTPAIEEQKRIGEALKAETDALKPVVEEEIRRTDEKLAAVESTRRRAERRLDFETMVLRDLQDGWGGHHG